MFVVIIVHKQSMVPAAMPMTPMMCSMVPTVLGSKGSNFQGTAGCLIVENVEM